MVVVAAPFYVLKGVNNVRTAWPTNVTDFPVFYHAGGIAVSDSRAHLYDPPADQVPSQHRRAIGHFFNPPLTAVLHAPLTLLARNEARLLFGGIVVAATLAAYLLAAGAGRRPAFLAVSAAGVVSFLPIYDALYLGHHTLILGLCMAGSLLAFGRGHRGLGGVLTGLLVLKPTLLLLPLAMLVIRDRRAAIAAASTAVVLGLAPFILIGLSSFVDYVELLWSTRSDSLRLGGERTGGAALMFNWAGFFSRLVRDNASPYLVWPLSAATVAMAAVAWRRRALPEAYLAASLATVTAVPHILNYDWVLLLAPCLYVAARTNDKVLAVLIAGLQLVVNLSIYEYWTGDPREGSFTLATPMACIVLAYLAFGAPRDRDIEGGPARVLARAGPPWPLLSRATRTAEK